MRTRQTNINIRRGLSFIVVAAMIVAFATANVSAQVYPSGMVSYWTFDETSGTTAYDAFNINNGQLMNGPVWTTGKVNNGLSLSNGQYVTVPNNAALNITGDLTIEMWVKPNSVTCSGPDPAYVLVSKRSSNVPTPYEFMIRNGGLLFYEAWNGNSGTYSYAYTATGVVTTGVWQHVAMTRSTGTVTFYVNGVAVSNIGQRSGPIAASSDPVWISRDGYHTGWTTQGSYSGLMDEVAICNRALSAEEIQQHYQNGLQGLGYEVIPVLIDIKPGSFPNSINLMSKGNVPVAILSSSTFDATTVDRSTVVFAGASPLPIGQTPEDVNSDGLLDVVLHFKTQDLNLKPYDTEACLTGKTLSGQEFEGCDSVRIVK